jgi:cell wall-associated NlpC family hydrolase
MLGFDCSGFVIEILKAVGILPITYDTTADGLFRMFKRYKISAGQAGALVFWFSGGVAIHVEMMLDLFHTIGASGGGSATISEDAAADQNAFIKIRPIGYRGADYKIVDPFAGGL